MAAGMGRRRSPSHAKAGAGETGRATDQDDDVPVVRMPSFPFLATAELADDASFKRASTKRPYWRRHQQTIIAWAEQKLRQAKIEGRPFKVPRKEHFLIEGLIEIAKLLPLPKGEQRKDPSEAWYEENEILHARIWRDRQVERGVPRKTATAQALKKVADSTGKSIDTVRGAFHSPQIREIARLVLLVEKGQREKVLKRVNTLLLKARNE
jgi:hypothetical protein